MIAGRRLFSQLPPAFAAVPQYLVHITVALLYRVARGGYPPPAPTERSVQISRTALFRNRFTAQRWLAASGRGAQPLVALGETVL